MKEQESSDYMKNIEWNNILNKITDIYIFLIIILFPLMVDSSGFLKILECKYKCFITISSIYIVSISLIVIYNIIIKNNILNIKKITKIKYSILIYNN